MKSLNNKIKLVAKLIIINLVLFGAPNLTSAKISHPYEIDQKPQILFGDSTEILVPNTDHTATTTYRGLENYIQDYKNGFAHFYFTYTHQACCTASYPPLIYITDVDPQSTSTPNEKLIAPAYALSQFWAGFGEPTDWYSYDIQFDASGYRVTVKQAGTNPIFDQRTEVTNLTHNDWVAIANRYPNLNEYSMAFVPVPINENLPPPKIDPVIIIPGIMGSAFPCSRSSPS
jgi:hypothetical protein